MKLATRPLDRGDAREVNFVIDSWVRSFQHADTAGMIWCGDWFPVMIKQVTRILSWPEVRTLVAYDPDDKSNLADVQGFISADAEDSVPIVYYVFVKEGYRRAGYARALFHAAGVDPRKPFRYPCTTGVVLRIRRNADRMPWGKWDPTLARFAKDDHRRNR